MNSKINKEEVDIIKIVQQFLLNKKIITKFLIAGIILGIIIAYSIPKVYTVSVTLAPESNESNANSNLANVASMFGVNKINENYAALNVTMFPEIIKSTPFIIDIYNLKIITEEKKNITLSEYVQTQRNPWWTILLSFPTKAIHKISSILKSPQNKQNNQNQLNTFQLTDKQSNIISQIQNSINAIVDAKTNITTVTVSFQDPVVTAIVADSIVNKLQIYITNYKTKKAIEDYKFLEKICENRKAEYYSLQAKYAKFIDSNKNISKEKAQSEGIRLKNELNIAYELYSQTKIQLQMARAKIQEAKPIFTTIEPASVPLRPSSPKKIIILLSCIFLSLTIITMWILVIKDIIKNIKNENDQLYK